MAVTHSTDTPGRVIPISDEEFEDFDTEATAFLRGERDPDLFTGFRLKQGVYGQRQADVQMIRVKLPFGGVSADQLDAFAEVAERFAPLKKGHITTRENVQYHHVPLQLAAMAIRVLGDAGLSSREACGNTVRNVPGDPWGGICNDEVYDATPYAGAFVRYFVRHPLTQLLPRKFKVAFTGSETDRVVTDIHDLGFISQIRHEDGKEVRGFRMVTGGGLSIMAKRAFVLYDFVPLTEYLRVSEAVLRIFERSDDLRRNRAKARIKFLVHRVGIDAFREMVEEELKGDWGQARLPARRPGVPGRRSRRRAGAEWPRADRCRGRPRHVRAVHALQRAGADSRGLRRHRGQGHPRRPLAGAVPRPGQHPAHLRVRARPHDAVAEHRAAAGFRRIASTTSGASSTRWTLAVPAPSRSPTSWPAPAPTAASWGSLRPWASIAPCRARSRR